MVICFVLVCGSVDFFFMMIKHHLIDLIMIDQFIIPGYTIIGGELFYIVHVSDELLVGSFISGIVILYTCNSSVIQERLILNPQGYIPGFIICPTIIGLGLGCCGLIFHTCMIAWIFLKVKGVCATCSGGTSYHLEVTHPCYHHNHFP